MNIALIAHDAKKELLVQFCIAYCGIISRHQEKRKTLKYLYNDNIDLFWC